MASNTHRGLLYAVTAAIFFSTSPVLIRWAHPYHALSITAGRLAVGSVTVLGLMVLRGRRLHLGWEDLPRLAIFGLITALHFLCYVTSLDYTTVAHSLSLTYTSPIFVTLFAAFLLGEPMSRQAYLGVGLTVVGVAVLAGFEPQMTLRMLVGDILALGSAICFGLYSTMGRASRTRYPLLAYTATIYGLAALWLTPLALRGLPPHPPFRAVGSLLLLGLLPLGLGHTLYNAALRLAHPTRVNVIATQEVTGGVLLGYLLLGEKPSPQTILGMILTLAGVSWVIFREPVDG
ncbi:MAG: DMT family transporter [Chloroflexota bacterium]|nr:DMT family transporter [Chloroflexota bacterium]